MTQTITINDIAQRIANEMNPHDSLIGILLEKYNLPEDGSAKGDKYDKEMIEILYALIDDIEERFYDLEEFLDENFISFDENIKQWYSVWVDMRETLEEELDNSDIQLEQRELSKREYLEVVYQNYHGCMKAGFDGAKMIAMFTSILGE